MKIFLAGATGAVGKQLVPLLASTGHEVVGTTRSADRAETLRAAGAEPVVLDLLDGRAVTEAVLRAEPDVIVHQATALSSLSSPKHFDREFAATNRLRIEGTDHLLAAARAAGVRRFVAQSYTGWPYARDGGPVKTESDPLDPDPPAAFRSSLEAIRHLERAVTEAEGLEGVVLRYGGFYGPGTSLVAGGAHADAVRRRKFPIVGSGAGVWSFVHIEDVATATLAAIDGDATGIFNIVDDEPAPVSEWLPVLAAALGAPPPRHVPAWVGRLVGGEATVVLMTESRGASNAKAKLELGWQPRYASWREGFRTLARAAERRSSSDRAPAGARR
jgi:nucleoside-diphosphate-sugar epimerase